MALKVSAVRKMDLGSVVKADMADADLEIAGKVNPQQAAPEKKKKTDGTDDDEDTVNKLQTPKPYTDMMRRDNPVVGLQKPVPMAGGQQFSSSAT